MTDTAEVHGNDFQCPVITHNPAENEQHKMWRKTNEDVLSEI